jgi:DNA sulfur modification protein DndB
MKTDLKEINLPCLRGRMGDWIYYVTLLKFSDVAERVFLPQEIDKKYEEKKNLKLGDWIQRDLESKRINDVIDYLNTQEQRFFNSLILGMYDGKPSYREIEVKPSDLYENEEDTEYFSKTFGILTLSGKESIFAIDGQHRAISIRKAIKKHKDLEEDEISVVFVAHRTDYEGKVRTRRLFSTLNRYAKPVNKKEIIALSEDDNCAILTRRLVEDYEKFKDRILISGNKSVNHKDKKSFTTIIQLYDIVVLLLCSVRITSVGVTDGENKKDFTNSRVKEEKLDAYFKKLTSIFDQTSESFSELNDLLMKNIDIDRTKNSTSLIFRPVGQEVFFKVLKAGMTNNKDQEVFQYFKSANFSFTNQVWLDVFWDMETETMITTKERQKYAYHLIMEKIGIPIKRSKRDKEMYDSFDYSIEDI